MTQYRCRRCSSEVEGSPLRVSCPDCGGQLRSVSGRESEPGRADEESTGEEPADGEQTPERPDVEEP